MRSQILFLLALCLLSPPAAAEPADPDTAGDPSPPGSASAGAPTKPAPEAGPAPKAPEQAAEADDPAPVARDNPTPPNDSEPQTGSGTNPDATPLQQIIVREVREQSPNKVRGRLVNSGFTVGYAAMAQSGGEADGLTTMPYVAIHWGYWLGGSIQNRACADAYVSTSAEETRATTRQLADELAAATVACIETELAVQNTPDATACLNILNAPKGDDKYADQEQKKEMVTSYHIKDITRAALRAWISHKIWAANRDALCWYKKLAVFAGLPLDYQSEKADEKYRPAYSLGIAFAPSAEFSFLVGWTRGQKLDLVAETPDWKSYDAFSLGFGGNLDLFGTLLSD